MSRTVESNIEGYEGTVWIKDSLTHEQLIAVSQAIPHFLGLYERAEQEERAIALVEQAPLYLEAVCTCIERARVNGFPEHPTPETWPITTARPATQFFNFVLHEVILVYCETLASIICAGNAQGD